MKRIATIPVLAALLALCFLPPRLPAQTACLTFVPLYAGPDSVRIKARMTTQAGLSFQMDGVFVCATYDATKFSVSAAQTIMNHRYSGNGWLTDSDPLYDQTNGTRGFALCLYGEDDPSFGGVAIPQNYDTQLCTFTFFPKSSQQDTTSFGVYANQLTAALTGYYISTTTANQIFSCATPLFVQFPVELTSFSAAQQGKSVIVSWTTASESNNYGFYVERRSHGADDGWQTLDFVKGAGDTKIGKSYIFIDETLASEGIYDYRLRQMDYDGSAQFSKTVSAVFHTEVDFALYQNFPNPISVSSGSSTTLQYSIAERSAVRLTVSNLLGEEIATIADQSTDAGVYTESWQPGTLPSGTYIATLSARSLANGLIRTASLLLNVVR